LGIGNFGAFIALLTPIVKELRKEPLEKGQDGGAGTDQILDKISIF